ncbi:MurR/RpiR family transcriptional regulator [Flexibacterium corallicola]|uniref:MurR/RpiR family transcriptional regulator n=1 Tax=Flexibacterium corallicola TaxID=3037259 RepID=UPI00286F4784|nr:MurR/RpiR family transcriptional regulator [Pseudovibrio sp. M1P-2-3]
MSSKTIYQYITPHYEGLSAKLKLAADFVLENPIDVAARSLRAISLDAKLPPSTFSRLARALKFESYEAMREVCRSELPKSFASSLTKESFPSASNSFTNSCAAHAATLEALATNTPPQALEQAAGALSAARNIVVVGALSSAGLAAYLGYLGEWLGNGWRVLGCSGSSPASELEGLGTEDLAVIIAGEPFAAQSIKTERLLKSQGIPTLIITDSLRCPALKSADHSFVIPSRSSGIFPTHVPMLALIETLVHLTAEKLGDTAKERARKLDQAHRQLGDYWE